jgi:hypothetical protein
MVIAVALLAATIFVPLWRMELVAPQYPEGLVLHAYGYKFAGDSASYYDDIREINGLNHYIGMAPIEEATEMSLFLPAVAALMIVTIAGSFIAWKRRLIRALMIAGFWAMPVFFVADLQYWLYHYGHSMDPEAPLNPGSFTPKVFGSTKVWNFHSETSFEVGFYLMVAAALVITLIPPMLGWLQSRRHRQAASPADAGGVPGMAKAL